MTVRTFLIGAAGAILISWTVWIMVIMLINPQQVGIIGYIMFFLTTFLAAASTTSLVGYGLRRLIVRRQIPAYSVRYSLRQGILLGLFIDAVLILQLMRIMYWWLILILITVFIFIEFFFLSYDQSLSRHRRLAGESPSES